MALSTLAYILLLLALGGGLLRFVLTEQELPRKDLLGYLAAWGGINAIAFVSHNFWLSCFLCGVLLFGLSKRHPPLALFVLSMYAVPPIVMLLPGIGPVNNLLTVDILRVSAWVLLLPLLSGASRDKTDPPLGSYATDWCLLGFIALEAALNASSATFTHALRQLIDSLTSIWLPYWVMSRRVRNLQDMRTVLVAFTLSFAVLALTGAFEHARGWLIYDPLPELLGAPNVNTYLLRGDSLRASASAGHSLILGYLMCLSLLMGLFFMGLRERPHSRAGWLLLVAGTGLYASLSRAPWMAAVLGMALWCLTSARPGRNFGLFLLIFSVVGGAALVSPAGDKIIDMIPWIGKTDSENVVYRQRLLEVSLIVLMESPWFGSTEFAYHPLMQTLIQGQGIIDMVNTYLGIAMATGVVGFTLFTGAFLGVLLPLGKALVQCRDRESVQGRFARVVFVGLLLTMFLIFTVSSTHALPWTYYSLMGLAVAAMRLLRTPTLAARSGTT